MGMRDWIRKPVTEKLDRVFGILHGVLCLMDGVFGILDSVFGFLDGVFGTWDNSILLSMTWECGLNKENCPLFSMAIDRRK